MGEENSLHLFFFENGSNNVSRWMTWLPISLKNAAKCDKWYQLQNHSITESLNAKGAWEKLFTSHPRACRILSVEHTSSSSRISVLVEECKREPLTLDENNQKIRVGAFSYRPKRSNSWTGGDYQKPTKNNVFVCWLFSRNLFTDLSAAGLPAELKHITQRRKRKQP